MLEDLGEDIAIWLPLAELNSFAVQYRYEEYIEMSDDYDRDATVTVVCSLFEAVKTKLADG
jgi:hypothetical protein